MTNLSLMIRLLSQHGDHADVLLMMWAAKICQTAPPKVAKPLALDPVFYKVSFENERLQAHVKR